MRLLDLQSEFRNRFTLSIQDVSLMILYEPVFLKRRVRLKQPFLFDTVFGNKVEIQNGNLGTSPFYRYKGLVRFGFGSDSVRVRFGFGLVSVSNRLGFG